MDFNQFSLLLASIVSLNDTINTLT